MKLAVFALAAAVLASGSAFAKDEVTDVDYLRASRCAGLAASIDGVVDPASLNAFVKAERVSRAPYIVDRGAEEFQKAKREAKSEDRRARLTSELSGSCQAYLGGGTTVAKGAGSTGTEASDVSKQ